MSKRRIGVYICHCGGNISDYVDVEKVRQAIEGEDGVVVAKTTMFACSDASQQEMIEDIKANNLDGMVVSSCSPKLHLMTFRGVAKRAGLNPYTYDQVNIREQDSWAHSDNPEAATNKAIALVKAGIAKASLSKPLEPIRIETVPRVLVIGGGVAGLRASRALADLGMTVYLVEKTDKLGGLVAGRKSVYTGGMDGAELVASMVDDIRSRENVQILTESELVEKSGSVGDFTVKIASKDGNEFTFNVGAIVVATGASVYEPSEGEYGYGLPGVVTLPEFLDLVDGTEEGAGLQYNGRDIESVAYIYCVGSRAEEDDPSGRTYCSRYCCTATMWAANLAAKRSEGLRQYHVYRDIRTYGKYETIFESASKSGSFIVRFMPEDPPEVVEGDEGLVVRVTDQLTENQKLAIEADLVVLVTGLTSRPNEKLESVLKLPVGNGGFYNEIHPKLRPVETVIDGVFLAGSCQFPKSLSESVASSLASVAKSSALLLKGFVELEPIVASVDWDACLWCGDCAEACPYGAIGKTTTPDGKEVAEVNRALCKGCGACGPACKVNAIELDGYTDAQVETAIEKMAALVTV